MPSAKDIIAVDGPAASGKGTLARALARELGYAYLDTGKLYRLVGWRVLRESRDPDDEVAASSVAEKTLTDFRSDMLALPELTHDDVSAATSRVAVYPAVRNALFDLQRNFVMAPPDGKPGAVLDGRDIGTVVCPEARVKFFVVADIPIRAERRFKELQSKGIDVTYEAVLADMQRRDARDTGRATAPLKPAEDAIILDTSYLSPDEALEKALHFARFA